MNKGYKGGFPFGIFLLLFLVDSLLGAAGTAFYFLHTGKKGIEEIEISTRAYAGTVVEAFADIAERSYRSENYKKLKSLMRDKISEQAFHEAFFILRDGTLVAHSSAEAERELKGNIANDEFTYNLDLILLPVRQQRTTLLFSDYNLISLRVPFPRRERIFWKRHLYERIDSNSWLVSKAIYSKHKPVGTINFIISKKRIYDFIIGHIDESLRLLRYLLAGVALFSLLASLVVMARYRSIRRRSSGELARGKRGGNAINPADEYVPVEIIDEGRRLHDVPRERGRVAMLYADIPHDDNADILLDSDRMVRDAIPVVRKR